MHTVKTLRTYCLESDELHETFASAKTISNVQVAGARYKR